MPTEQTLAARLTAMATHRFAWDGDPEDGNVMCTQCGCKPAHKVAAQRCPASEERNQ